MSTQNGSCRARFLLWYAKCYPCLKLSYKKNKTIIIIKEIKRKNDLKEYMRQNQSSFENSARARLNLNKLLSYI